MLPHCKNLYRIGAAIIAGQFLATASFGQSYETIIPDGPAPKGPYSLGGKFQFGAATIDLNQDTPSTRFNLESTDFTDRPEESGATFTLNLSENFPGQDGSGLFPMTLSLSTHKTDLFGRPQTTPQFSPEFSIGALADPSPSGQTKSDYMISADWGSPEDRVTFSFSSRTMGQRLDSGENAHFGDDMLNFTRTLRTGGWLSSFTASVGRGYREETGNRERTQKYGASANFKTLADSILGFDITARVLQDRTVNLTPGTGDVDTKWELRTGSRILGAASREELTTQPSLSIFFSVKGNAPDEEDEDTHPVDFSAGVTGKVHF